MCHINQLNPSVFSLLYRIDQSIASQALAGGCEHCHAPLHRADYPRKPRALPKDPQLKQQYSTRFSFCCSNPDCRKRNTPASMRFLGARVYVGFVMVLMSALVCGLTPALESRLVEYGQIPKQTLHRWITWWRTTFVRSHVWQRLKAQFVGAVALPTDLLHRIRGDTLSDCIVRLLAQLLPMTSNSSGYLPEGIHPQNL